MSDTALKIRIDYNNMMEEFVGKEGVTEEEIAAWQPAAEQAMAAMKEKRGSFVGTFRTQDSEDKFVFLRHVPFTKSYETAFTEEDMRLIYPAFGEDE